MESMKKKALIIEDDVDLAKLLAVRFMNRGFEVIIASDGIEGIERATEMSPDIVTLDLMLPGMPGEEVCRCLRREKKTENLPIIMLTAKNSDVDRIVGKVIGADNYISKPFDIETLFNRVDELLAGTGQP